MRYLVASVFIFFVNTAHSQGFLDSFESVYLGGGVNFIDTRIDVIGGSKLNFTALELVTGVKYNRFLGLDARIGVSINNEALPGNQTAELPFYYAVYWRPESKNATAKLYGLLGFAGVESEIAVAAPGGNAGSTSTSGLSYGAGVGFALDEKWNLNIEGRKLLDTDNESFATFAINVDRRF